MPPDTYLYLHDAGTLWLAERWVAQQREALRIVGLAESEDASRALSQCLPRIDRIEVLAAHSDSYQQSVVVLPLSITSTLLDYRMPHSMPLLDPWYPLLRRLHRAGFRTFEIVTLHGTRRYCAPFLLDNFHNRHANQRCFVAGNGPSLNNIDMKKLAGEVTLGSNRCYLGYEKWGFPFTYWGVYDHLQIQRYAGDYERHVPHETPKFFPLHYWPLLDFAHACPVNIGWHKTAAHGFSADPEQLFVGYTVTHMLLQIAAVMGCNPIILIGVDHRYGVRQQPRGIREALGRGRRMISRRMRGTFAHDAAAALVREWRLHEGECPSKTTRAFWSTGDSAIPTHFDSRYTAAGANKFLPPEPGEAERDFAAAAAWAQSAGVQILNATPGSALTTFPAVAYERLF